MKNQQTKLESNNHDSYEMALFFICLCHFEFLHGMVRGIP